MMLSRFPFSGGFIFYKKRIKLCIALSRKQVAYFETDDDFLYLLQLIVIGGFSSLQPTPLPAKSIDLLSLCQLIHVRDTCLCFKGVRFMYITSLCSSDVQYVQKMDTDCSNCTDIIKR